MTLGVDHSLSSGVTGAEFYTGTNGAGHFWQLEALAWEDWVAQAQWHNGKSQHFWKRSTPTFSLASVPTSPLAPINKTLRCSTSSPATSGRPAGPSASRLAPPSCFPTGNPPRTPSQSSFAEPDVLFARVSLPIQEHGPEMAGTRILDLAVSLVLRLPAYHKRPILDDRILDTGTPEPCAEAARAHRGFWRDLCPHETVMSRWLSSELSEDLEICERLKRCIDAKLAPFGVEIRDYSTEDYLRLTREAGRRLLNSI
ncbi:hypothetical protein DFH09DRAFT_1100717 [Mycena vulgaris]|nr:hypothetical protein DFH09DRAFT_1100717 [Mycena vulgaris]